jgi:hypothetical protein
VLPFPAACNPPVSLTCCHDCFAAAAVAAAAAAGDKPLHQVFVTKLERCVECTFFATAGCPRRCTVEKGGGHDSAVLADHSMIIPNQAVQQQGLKKPKR